MMNYNELKNLIDGSIAGYLPAEDNYSYILERSELYSLAAGGKRLRPCLLLAVSQMLNGDIYDCMPFAAAVEFIHTYSLIHDDLPAMDNDEMRRGKPANHKVFGEDIAILAGDALLTRAFWIMSDAIAQHPSENNAKAMRCISACAYNMVRGQVSDIKASGDANGDYLFYVHLNKTASLIKASVTAGAYLAGSDKDTIKKIELLGDNLGLAFQLRDDFSDYDTDTCLNHVRLLGREYSEKKFCFYMSEVNMILDGFDNNEVLKNICALEL